MNSRGRALPGGALRLLPFIAMLAACGGSSGPTTPATMPPATTLAPAPPAVSSVGLALLMHMDEAVWQGAPQEVRDNSFGSHHGRAAGGANTVANGRFGRAGQFFGSASCIEVPDAPSLHPADELTISAWVQPSQIGRGAMGIAARRVNFTVNSAYAFFVAVSGRLSVDVNTEDDRFEAGPQLAVGRWYHVAMVYEGARQTVVVYLDGAAVGAHSESALSITPFDAPEWVGCLPEGGPSQGFEGLMDDVAIWHRALSATEVAALARGTGAVANP